ncbi:hypothetical protein BKA81DRAFT_366697 [Phyllosticta paracitricarpa]
MLLHNLAVLLELLSARQRLAVRRDARHQHENLVAEAVRDARLQKLEALFMALIGSFVASKLDGLCDNCQQQSARIPKLNGNKRTSWKRAKKRPMMILFSYFPSSPL